MHSGYHYDYHYKQGDPFRLEKVDVKSFATETEKADTIRMVNLYEFDGNGNQTMEVANPINDSTCLTDTAGSKVRQYLWDEDNRMLAANVNGFVSNYFYDAAGERTVKISAPDLAVFVNGAEALKNDSALVKFVGYVSPYLVVSNGGRYTKHIYAGTQRIASKLGDIEAFGADPRRVEYAGANLKEVDFGSKYEQQTKALLARYDSLGVEHRPNTLNDYVGGQSFCCGEKEFEPSQTGKDEFETSDYEQLIFFYHPDHLGSTTLVTDNDGNVVQSVAYIPYGEVFIEERNGTWNTPYLFNGKELDEETGLYYYGARYLNPTNGMWLSVDPLWENRQGISPFNYCLSNPIKMIDPDGMWEKDADGNWIAQKNDNAYTLAKTLNVNPSDVIQMMKEQGFEFTEGDKKVNLQIGDKFTIGGNRTNENAIRFSDEAIEVYRSNFGGYPTEKGLENVSPEFEILCGGFGIKQVFDVVSKIGSKSLGYGRSQFRKFLQKAGQLERNELEKGLQKFGFKRLHSSPQGTHYGHGNIKVRIDPPQKGTPNNHMHVEYGKKSDIINYNKDLMPVNRKSPNAHILIK